MIKLCRQVAEIMGFALIFLLTRVDAQTLRDPTVPPAEARPTSDLVDGKSTGIASGAMTIIVRNERPFLVVGTRLYAQGQKLGQARIERITETEVWLREGGVLRKLPQFSGIQRRSVFVTPAAAKPTCAARVSKSSSAVAPCPDVQP